MKRLIVGPLVLFALLVSSNIQAAQVWNWSFDQLAGTFTTVEMLMPGSNTYTLDNFIVSEVGTSAIPTGSTDLGPWVAEVSSPTFASTFTWDTNTNTATNFLQDPFSGWFFTSIGVNGISFDDDGTRGEWLDNNEARGSGDLNIAPVPIPAAAWLFMSGILGLVWKGRKAVA